ncbi:DUF4134 family protein [Salegentibacter sp. F188]|uniref:DUF4134 family protein n=1 Tax=Autumnicola patrickiae TaxID=3075591 RepID=A0ABU3E5E5_9FLAO|nr:DUF4134 family protein [Salegentibacter sp. F188]MDT0691226.1 DUF4134 family protein [Salegentibacter sp. F188]
MKNAISIFKNLGVGQIQAAKNFALTHKGTAVIAIAMVATATSYGQDNLTEGLEGISGTFQNEWWPRIKVIAYILAGVFALFGLVNVFRQSQRGEDNVGKVAGAWVGGLAVFLLGIWAVDTFIIGAATGI